MATREGCEACWFQSGCVFAIAFETNPYLEEIVFEEGHGCMMQEEPFNVQEVREIIEKEGLRALDVT